MNYPNGMAKGFLNEYKHPTLLLSTKILPILQSNMNDKAMILNYVITHFSSKIKIKRIKGE